MKRFICMILALVLALGLMACGAEEAFDLSAYKDAVSSCCAAVDENIINYGNIAQYQNNYWNNMEKFTGTVTEEKLLAASEEWFTENTSTSFADLDALYQEHTATYKEIILTEIEGQEAEEIDALFRSLFGAYTDLHNMVMSPSCSHSEFIQNYNEYIDAYTSAQSRLELFLE